MKSNLYKRESTRLHVWLWVLSLLVAVALSFRVFENTTLAAAILTLFLPLLLVSVYRNPTTSMYLLVFYAFAVFAFSRYILINDYIKPGTVYDVMLLLAFIIAWLVMGNENKVQWARILDTPFWVLIIWLFYCCFSLVVPGNAGFNVWLLGVRVHLYMVFSIPLFIMLLNVKSLKTLIILWGIFSIIMSLKGFAQQNIWLDAADLAFLDGNEFHMVGGKLRVYGFCSDAGQFGVQQGHAAVIGGLMFLNSRNGKQRLFFLLMALAGLYGMFVSGTRGAIFVIFGSAMAYCFLIRRTKLLILGLVLSGGFYSFMVFTNVGNSVYDIQRMRTAFKPEEDPSYLARKMNQEILKAYLRSRPFGGGIGAMQFGHQGTLLKETPYDSGYVLTWGDQGIVGLSMYIGMILLFLLKGTLVVWNKIKNEWLRNIVIAMMSGIVGIAVSNYGNPVMLQHPTCVLYFLSVAVIYSAPRIDKSLQIEEQVVKQKTTSTQMLSASRTAWARTSSEENRAFLTIRCGQIANKNTKQSILDN